MSMDRRELVLAAMSPAHTGPFSPVQVQKLFFLLDRNIAEQINGPHFDFEPYDYGPFDKAVYDELGEMSDDGFVEIIEPGSFGSTRTYRLTSEGYETGKKSLDKLPETVQQYILEVVEFVRSLSFAQLVSAIYQAYPDTKVNSVFSDRAS